MLTEMQFYVYYACLQTQHSSGEDYFKVCIYSKLFNLDLARV